MIPKLPATLNNQPFSLQKALQAGLTKYAIKGLLDEGVIEKVTRGVYQRADFDSTSLEGQFQIAVIRCQKPSSICLLSALAYYHLTDVIPQKTWIMVDQAKRVRGGDLQLIRSRHPQWNVGIDKQPQFWITGLERTLVECMVFKKRLGANVAIEALRQALNQKKTKAGPIIDMAKRLGYLHRVIPYLEALA